MKSLMDGKAAEESLYDLILCSKFQTVAGPFGAYSRLLGATGVPIRVRSLPICKRRLRGSQDRRTSRSLGRLDLDCTFPASAVRPGNKHGFSIPQSPL